VARPAGTEAWDKSHVLVYGAGLNVGGSPDPRLNTMANARVAIRSGRLWSINHLGSKEVVESRRCEYRAVLSAGVGVIEGEY
jgi:hypothetical protein